MRTGSATGLGRAGDDAKTNQAAKEIRHAARRSGAARIVVNPFVHLTADKAFHLDVRGDEHSQMFRHV